MRATGNWMLVVMFAGWFLGLFTGWRIAMTPGAQQ